MSNYIEYNDTIVFHPGYSIEEMLEDSGLSQEDFAKRLGTTPKNLSLLIRGEQSLSIDMATKLSRMLGTSVSLWLNLQRRYDEVQAEMISDQETQKEREIMDKLDYGYFVEYFSLPETLNTDEQVTQVRTFLNLSSLSLLQQPNLTANMASRLQAYAQKFDILKANIMTQTAINEALKIKGPKYHKNDFLKAADYALTQTAEPASSFYPSIQKAFLESGAVLIRTPDMDDCGIDGAVKVINNRILLMVNSRCSDSYTFWNTLFRDIGQVLNGEYGFVLRNKQIDDAASSYARSKLTPQDEYSAFLQENTIWNENAICDFSRKINRNPGIVANRLREDHILKRDTDLVDILTVSYDFQEMPHRA